MLLVMLYVIQLAGGANKNFFQGHGHPMPSVINYIVLSTARYVVKKSSL